MSRNKLDQGLINHVALVLDASSSMHGLTRDVIKVADAQIKHLAERSQQMDQETRVTVYVFGSDVQCVIYDKDVLRLPSIAEFYRPDGCTALIDATMKSQDDLALIPEIYADHAFLSFILTDGQQYQPHRSGHEIRRATEALRTRLEKLPENWTVAVLVPNAAAKHEAKQYGFQADNISVWNTDSKHGLEEGFASIRQATDTFMTNRAVGIRGSRAVFSTGADAVNAQAIKAAGLKPLSPKEYIVTVVPPEHNGAQIKDFVQDVCGYPYRVRRGYYELLKREKIQGDKEIAIKEKKTGKIYVGDGARGMIGLGDGQQSVFPNFNPDYKIFVQSGSVNRKMVVGGELLYLI